MADISHTNAPAAGAASTGTEEQDKHAAAIALHKKRTKFGLLFWIPLGWLIVVAVAAIGAPFWGLPPPDEIDWAYLQSPPSEAHWLGTDVLGRDLLSRIIWGARVSLTVGFAAPAIGVGAGLILGMAAGYYRGWVDEIVGIAIDSWLAIPGLVVLLLFAVIFGGSLFMVCFSLGLLFIPTAARITAELRRARIRAGGSGTRRLGRPDPGERGLPEHHLAADRLHPDRHPDRHRDRGLAVVPGPFGQGADALLGRDHRRGP